MSINLSIHRLNKNEQKKRFSHRIANDLKKKNKNGIMKKQIESQFKCAQVFMAINWMHIAITRSA